MTGYDTIDRSLLSSNFHSSCKLTVDKEDDLVTKEVESWRGFEYALRNPNASLFNQMLKECLEDEEYPKAFETKGSQYSTESLFMALIFQRRKMISKLTESLRSNQK